MKYSPHTPWVARKIAQEITTLFRESLAKLNNPIKSVNTNNATVRVVVFQDILNIKLSLTSYM